jgi:glutamate-5-semialdehyde dehydrogenase
MAVVTSELITKAKAARAAFRQVRSLSTVTKNKALYAIADALEKEQGPVLEANAMDMAAGREAGLSDALLDRLLLDQGRLAGLAQDVRNVAALPDPVGESFDARTLPNGIQLARRRVPLGVIGTIYESRPNVTVDISTLAFKSGNTVVLRGGKEAVHSNDALASLVRRCLEKTGVTPEAVQFIQSTDRSLVEEMVKLDQYIDLLIPRGGPSLINFVAKEATMPAITGGIGVCHTYVDASADVAMADEIVFNAKVQRPTVCNALDTVLVHPAVAPRLLPQMARHLAAAGVELRCDRRALALIGPAPAQGSVKSATDEDWGKEFLALVLAVKVVDSFQEAIDHIERYGSGHTEAIVTSDYANAMRFVDEVDAAVVLVNASTRFNDGGQFGLGTEVAISTNKLHARGPMGLRELTTYKWVALGQGQVRQ